MAGGSVESLERWLNGLSSLVSRDAISSLTYEVRKGKLDVPAFEDFIYQRKSLPLHIDDLNPKHIATLRKCWKSDFGGTEAVSLAAQSPGRPRAGEDIRGHLPGKRNTPGVYGANSVSSTYEVPAVFKPPFRGDGATEPAGTDSVNRARRMGTSSPSSTHSGSMVSNPTSPAPPLRSPSSGSRGSEPSGREVVPHEASARPGVGHGSQKSASSLKTVGSSGQDWAAGRPSPKIALPVSRGIASRIRDRRSSVCASVVSSAASKSWKLPYYEKGDGDYEQLRDSLRRCFLFDHLDTSNLDKVIGAFCLEQVPPSALVIRQGDLGDKLYVVAEGKFDVHQLRGVGQDQKVCICKTGEIFGELALLYNAPRAATVKTRRGGSLWALDRETFAQLVVGGAAAQRVRRERWLRDTKIFASLSKEEIAKLVDVLEYIDFVAGDEIITEGEPGDAFYIVEDGECKAYVGSRRVAKYKRGGYFGELALLNDQPRAASVVASTARVRILRLDRGSFQALLQNHFLEDVETQMHLSQSAWR